MAHYVTPLTRIVDNILFTDDGKVWATYILTGINTNTYNPKQQSSAYASTEALFRALKACQSDDYLILGTKQKTSPMHIIKKCATMPERLVKTNYEQFEQQINALYQQIETNNIVEHTRLYVLAISIPKDTILKSPAITLSQKIKERIFVSDRHRHYNPRTIQEKEKRFFTLIPNEFQAVRPEPEFMYSLFDRIRYRSIKTFPIKTTGQQASPKTFGEILITKNGDVESLLERVAERMPDAGSKDARNYLRKLRNRWNELLNNQVLSVTNREDRNEQFPEGLVSYQSTLILARWPQTKTNHIHDLTRFIDTNTRLDADFTIRFWFDDALTNRTHMGQFDKAVQQEQRANAKESYTAARYVAIQSEMSEFSRSVHESSHAAGMNMSVMFTFAHQNREYLHSQLGEIDNYLTSLGFAVLRPSGAQYDLWRASFPGVSIPPIVADHANATTTEDFAGFAPVRSSRAGDLHGIPLGQITSNTLGTLVYNDMLTATDRGSGSIALTGAQGAGKSEEIKCLCGWCIDLHMPIHLIDGEGEHAKYAEQFPSHTIIDVAQGWHSLDILKIADPSRAAEQFITLYTPLLEHPSTAETNFLTMVLDQGYRHLWAITSTRTLIAHLDTQQHVPEAKSLSEKLTKWGQQEYARTFIDPVINGTVIDLPPVEFTELFTVFYTRGLEPFRGKNIHDATQLQLFSLMAYTAIAFITEERFARLLTPCVFAGDEMAFLKGSQVLERLIYRQDRTGRKRSVMVIAAGQLAEDFDDNYKLIKKRIALKQDTEENAVAALKWVGLKPTQELIDDMLPKDQRQQPVTQTPDTPTPDTYLQDADIDGQETAGQCWYNDGTGNIVPLQLFGPLLPERRAAADTTSSRYIRYDDTIKALMTEKAKHAKQEYERRKQAINNVMY